MGDAVLDRIEQEGQAFCDERPEVTMIVGLTRRGGRDVRAFRSTGARFAPLPDERTLYEIGSYSKVYTTALLSILVAQGVLALEDRVDRFFPDLELKPEIAEITVFDLATHTGGLSGDGTVLAKLIADAVATEDPAKFTYYADYTKAHLEEELRVAELVRPRGTGWEYSRTGLSMLGHLLEVASGEAYEPLLKKHICEPLGLTDTTYTLSADQERRFVHGYAEDGSESPVWYWDVMLPQGGIRSTMDDMLTFIEANLAADDSRLTADLVRAQQAEFAWPAGSTRSPAPYGSKARFTQALGWWNLDNGRGPVTQHAGATMSYQSFGALHRATGTGFVAMTSSESNLLKVVDFPAMGQRLVDAAVEQASA